MSNRHIAVWVRENRLARQVGLPVEAQKWLYSLVIMLLLSLLAMLYLAQTGYVARRVEEMRALEIELVEAKKANSELRLALAAAEDWTALRQRAAALGLQKPERTEYVEVPLPDVTPENTAGGLRWIPGPGRAPEGRLGDLWVSIQAQLDAWMNDWRAPLPTEAAVEGGQQ